MRRDAESRVQAGRIAIYTDRVAGYDEAQQVNGLAHTPMRNTLRAIGRGEAYGSDHGPTIGR